MKSEPAEDGTAQVHDQLISILGEILPSGEWYMSALEFNHGVDGEELHQRASKIFEKVTGGTK